MKKIYAVFLTYAGNGTKCTFVNNGTEEEVDAFLKHNSQPFNKMYFLKAIAELPTSDSYIDVDRRAWFIEDWNTYVQCDNFPAFSQSYQMAP